MTDSKEDGTMTPKHFTEDEKFALAAAAQAMHNHGIPIACPWEGDLDDLEIERFVAMWTAIHAHNTALSASSPPVGGSGEVVARQIMDLIADCERWDRMQFGGSQDFRNGVATAKEAVATRLRLIARAVPNGVPEGAGECRYCANTGWFYGDAELKTYCGCDFGKLREELSPASPVTPEGLSGGEK